MTQLDFTHDMHMASWVGSANGHASFPLQNLPLGIFSSNDDSTPRAGVAIGDAILDLRALARENPADAPPILSQFAHAAALNDALAQGAPARLALRHYLHRLLAADTGSAGPRPRLHAASDCTLHLPMRVGNYTDFFAGIHHARNAAQRRSVPGGLFPNYKHLPIAYHGRASSVRASGWAVRRPCGQFRLPDEPAPQFGPTRKLDFELELGVWIGTPSELGQPVPIAGATAHIAGYCLSNDLSARDIQVWEQQPLGPFLAKNFGTVVSPWIVTPEALAPFVTTHTREVGDPPPLPYLDDARDRATGGLRIDLEVLLHTGAMRSAGIAAERISTTSTANLYWSVAQMIAHHTVGGCDLQAGDLLGSGTISGDTPGSAGSLIELTGDGHDALSLSNGERRCWLEDGDEIILRARCQRPGYAPIGFGDCSTRVEPAR